MAWQRTKTQYPWFTVHSYSKKRIKRMQKSAQTHGTQRDSLVDKLRETLIITDWVRLYFFLPTLQHDTYKNIPKKTERRMNMKVRKCGTMRSCCLRRASIFGHPTMMHTWENAKAEWTDGRARLRHWKHRQRPAAEEGPERTRSSNAMEKIWKRWLSSRNSRILSSK